MVNLVVKWSFEVGRAAKGGTCAGTRSPAPPLHYLARIATLHYDRRPGQEGDAVKDEFGRYPKHRRFGGGFRKGCLAEFFQVLLCSSFE
jgi:hypothetical protein